MQISFWSGERKEAKERKRERQRQRKRMGRAPCCVNEGVKKGPWSPEEDKVLVDYIHRYGHGNWRALPKQAGLLRCGKSCRLRWTNYLKPDIKRGNFTKEEEETIISLHEKLGNKWSAIAAKLPGRTDNEIKNVWHTHLKKRIDPKEATPVSKKKKKRGAKKKLESEQAKPQLDTDSANPRCDDDASLIEVPLEQSHSDSTAKSGDGINNNAVVKEGIDESFWLEALTSIDSCAESMNLAPLGITPAAAVSEAFSSTNNSEDTEFWIDSYAESMNLASLEVSTPAAVVSEAFSEPFSSTHSSEDMDFWLKVFMEADTLEDLSRVNHADILAI